LSRKNALFYKTLNGAGVGDLFMSLIHTCELNRANPFDYLTELQRHGEEIKQSQRSGCPGITARRCCGSLRAPPRSLIIAPSQCRCAPWASTRRSAVGPSLCRSKRSALAPRNGNCESSCWRPRAARYDKLGVVDSLLQLQITLDRKRLLAAERFLPLLDTLAANESYMHTARARAAEVAAIIRAPKP